MMRDHAPRPQPRGRGEATTDSVEIWLRDRLPDWGAIWAGCVRRFRAWRVPPRWSVAEWREEAQALGVAAAWTALRDYDPARRVPLGAFVHRRVLTAVLTRYRQEWAYGARCRRDDEAREPRADDPPPADGARDLSEILATRLAALDRRLIEHLFWDGWTEERLAGTLGISQQAVSKRKLAIFSALRRSIGAEYFGS